MIKFLIKKISLNIKKILDEKEKSDGKVKIKVLKDGFYSGLVRLNPNKKLSKIRQVLEKNMVILNNYLQ